MGDKIAITVSTVWCAQLMVFGLFEEWRIQS